jgi:hypothetical protein
MRVEDEMDMIQPAAGGAILLSVVTLAELPVGIGQFHDGQADDVVRDSGGAEIGLGGKFCHEPPVGLATLGTFIFSQITNMAPNTNVCEATWFEQTVLRNLRFLGGRHCETLSVKRRAYVYALRLNFQAALPTAGR